MKVPLLDLRPQLLPLREEILQSITNVIDSTRYIQGPEVEALEEEIADYCGAGSGVGVSSGTDALLVALMALDIGPGDLVLTSPFSFFATMGVILRVGARPVFADIDPVSFNVDPACIEQILVKDTERKIKAVLPVHLYGQCADMTRIMEIAKTYELPVIEDAAQAIGSECPFSDKGATVWRKAGSIGKAGCFSFFPSKNLGGVGDGGMVITRDESYATKIRLLRNHGAHPKYLHDIVGGNFRLDPIQAAVLRIKLRHLESWHQARRDNAGRYNSLIQESRLVEKGFVKIPEAIFSGKQEPGTSRNYHIYNQYVLRVERRDDLRAWLTERDIGTEIYYPLPLHMQKCVADKINAPVLPHAEKAATETLALPIFPELTVEMQEYVVSSIADFYQ